MRRRRDNSTYVTSRHRNNFSRAASYSGMNEERLAHPNRMTFVNAITQFETRSAEDDDRGAVFEVAHLVALHERRAARNSIRPFVAEVEGDVDEVEMDARDQNCGDRYERERFGGSGQLECKDGPLVPAVQAFDAPKGDRVDVPGVARDVGDVIDFAVRGRMKPMVHAGSEPQSGVAAAAVPFDEKGIGDQIFERIGETLCLHEFGPAHPSAGGHNAVAGTDQHLAPRIYRACAGFELPHETIVQAREARL